MKRMLMYLLWVGSGVTVFAQTTGTFVVADNGSQMVSCLDTNITIQDVYTQLGIRDLHDTNETVANYRLLEVNGSVISSTEISSSFKYSDYTSFYIEKKNTPHTGRNGVQVFTSVIIPPTSLFSKDTLHFEVDKEATVRVTEAFFSTFLYWNSVLDTLDLPNRILFKNMQTGMELPISQTGAFVLGKGEYKYTYYTSVCSVSDVVMDSLFIIVEESPCHNIEVRNTPSFCLDEIADITPYVYVDGELASENELISMFFYDRSSLTNPEAGGEIEPTAFSMQEMWNSIDRYPKIQIVYQPNEVIGTCSDYYYYLDARVPLKLLTTDVLMPTNNAGDVYPFTVDKEYYAFDNTFPKNTLQALYLDNFNVYDGSTFYFYSDAEYTQEVVGENIPVGTYYLLALNPACTQDSAKFTIQVKERDFQIVFEYEQNRGKGYYTFSAPLYSGATYEWMQWGGAIVSGQGTSQVVIYYSEDASQSVFAQCKITLPNAKTDGPLQSAVYLTTDENGAKEPIYEVITGLYEQKEQSFASVYPNPVVGGVFYLSGEQQFDVEIYNALGQPVFEQKSYEPNTPLTLNEKGVHVIQLFQNGKIQSLKVVLE